MTYEAAPGGRNAAIARVFHDLAADIERSGLQNRRIVGAGGAVFGWMTFADEELPAPDVSDGLLVFLRAEAGDVGGDCPATLGSAFESLKRMPDALLAEGIEGEGVERAALAEQLESLVNKYGFDYEIGRNLLQLKEL